MITFGQIKHVLNYFKALLARTTTSLAARAFGSEEIHSCHHPVRDAVFSMLFLFYDRSIASTQEHKKQLAHRKDAKVEVSSHEHGSTVTALWSNLVKIYKSEEHSLTKSTKLNYATLFPTNFEKQKVSLAMNIFNEKTVAESRVIKKQLYSLIM